MKSFSFRFDKIQWKCLFLVTIHKSNTYFTKFFENNENDWSKHLQNRKILMDTKYCHTNCVATARYYIIKTETSKGLFGSFEWNGTTLMFFFSSFQKLKKIRLQVPWMKLVKGEAPLFYCSLASSHLTS